MILHGHLLIDPCKPPRLGWIAIEGDRIIEVGEGSPPERPLAGDPHSIICPGFVDTHLHLPQIKAIGCDGLELLEWLDTVIYPAETTWSAPTAAAIAAQYAYNRMLQAGTLGFAAYLTSHPGALAAAEKAAATIPLRAMAGQVLMDRNGPSELLGHPLSATAPTDDNRLSVSINPRFAVSCTDELLTRARELSFTDNLFVQTHLAESRRECELVGKLFPDDPHYTGVYVRHGLVHDRTLLAHCLHLADEEWSLIAEREAVVVHCPAANTFLSSGLFDLGAAYEHEVRLALGSDIAAGPDQAMPRVGRAMIEVAKLRRLTIDDGAPIPTPAEAWDMITAGNANALGWSDAGRIEVGAAADLLILDLPFDIDEHLIGRLLYTWDDSYITDRIVRGALTLQSPC